MEEYLKKIKDQLKRMSEKEKDEWIFAQAKILPDWKWEDFYKSLAGSKKVIDMPGKDEISEFCEKVRNGDICVEYETHYVEFDDEGHYHDDWEQEFHDPDRAMRFLSSVITGCHDLIILEEYRDAFEILEEILTLQFSITEHPDSEDSCEEEFLDLNQAIDEGLLRVSRKDLLMDYMKSCRKVFTDCKEAAEKMTAAFEMELFGTCKPDCGSMVFEEKALLTEVKKKLKEELFRLRKEFEEKSAENKYYWGSFEDKKCIEHLEALAEYFEQSRETKKKNNRRKTVKSAEADEGFS